MKLAKAGAVAALALACAGGGPGERGPVPLGAPLPSAAIDASLFPENLPARYEPRGAVRFVAPGGDDAAAGTEAAPFRTIRRALAAAVSDGAVVVRAGTYAEGEPGDDDHALRIAADGLIVRAALGERATVRPRGEGVGYGLEIAASRVTWSGISLEGFAANGISLGADGRTIRDIVIADATVTMPAGGDGIAIYPDQRASGAPVVDGLLLERIAVIGADLGITVSSGPVKSVAMRDIVVRNRGTRGGNSGFDAIGFESGDNVLVNGADVSAAEGDGIDLKATRVAVLNAHVHGVHMNGVKLWLGGDIVNALVYDCGADASIVLGPAAPGPPLRYRIVNSLVAFHNRREGGAAAYAMTVGYDTPEVPIELELVNTVFYRNAGGIALSKGTRASVRSCVFFGAANGQVAEFAWDGAASRTIEASAAPAALAQLGAASGNLPFATDPRLADPKAASLAGFRPAPGSPLIDAGAVRAPFPALDLIGAPRVQGGKPDIGPFEVR